MDNGVLQRQAIRLTECAGNRDDAIRRCGQTLVEIGAVTQAYVHAMLARERSISTYVGYGVAIPHATEAGPAVLRDAIAVLRFPDGVDWAGFPVTVCVAIAARGNRHVALLAELAHILLDADRARMLRETDDVDQIFRLLVPPGRTVTTS